MKLIELLNKIANGEVKEGTKIDTNLKKGLVFKDGTLYYEDTIVTFTDITQKGLNVEVEIIEEKPQGRWKPGFEEEYWYIDNGGEVGCHTWIDDDVDKFLYLFKNIFKTRQEAQEYLEYKTALLEAEEPFVEGYDKENWFIVYDCPELRLSWSSSIRYQGAIYLGQDKDVAQAFVDKWGKQILKYEFGIEE